MSLSFKTHTVKHRQEFSLCSGPSQLTSQPLGILCFQGGAVYWRSNSPNKLQKKKKSGFFNSHKMAHSFCYIQLLHGPQMTLKSSQVTKTSLSFQRDAAAAEGILKRRHPLFVIVAIQSLSCVRLFGTPWTAALQASLSFTISQSLLRLMSIESVMPSNHLILCRPLYERRLEGSSLLRSLQEPPSWPPCLLVSLTLPRFHSTESPSGKAQCFSSQHKIILMPRKEKIGHY